MNKEASTQITKAKVQLILTNPFFATLALNMEFHEDSTIDTACTDGKSIRYNPDFVNKLSLDQTKGLIAHECLHPGMLHNVRRQGRDPQKWNIACDYAINPLLTQSGFVLPEGGCNSPQYADKSAEEIYNLLPDMPKDKDGQSKGSGNDPGGNGGVGDANASSQAEVQQIEQEAKLLMSQAAQTAKMQGNLPAHLERLVNQLLEPVVDWHTILSQFLTELAKNDYTFRKPSRRYLSQGLYLPSLESIEKGRFALLVDTSGSIDEKVLNEFAAEIQGILSESAHNLTVIYVDAEVAGMEEFEPDEQINLHPAGGGGTDFKPGFEYIQDNDIDPACVVYFTDGCCNSFPRDPGYPVLWATVDNKQFSPPFGEVIHL